LGKGGGPPGGISWPAGIQTQDSTQIRVRTAGVATTALGFRFDRQRHKMTGN
jgi:hypothetical protein